MGAGAAGASVLDLPYWYTVLFPDDPEAKVGDVPLAWFAAAKAAETE